MKLLVANNAAPFVRGGAELLADRLVLELRRAGHEAELLRLPLGDTPEQIVDGMIAAATLTAVNVDRIIGLKFPAYLIPHHDVVVWLVHQLRQAYDPAPVGWPDDARLGEVKAAIHAADGAAFARAQRLYAISPVVADRLQRATGLHAEVLLTPPHAEVEYRTGPAGDYLLAHGRISDGKRQFLAIEAMVHARPGYRLVVAGSPDSPESVQRLEALVDRLGVRDRVQIIGRFLASDELLDLIAHCIGSVYLPLDEDSYGYVCYEAAMSGKPLITASDSGGTHTLVAEGVTGLIAEPDPLALATAFDLLALDLPRSAEMGLAARDAARGLDLSWSRVVQELTR